MKQLLKKIINPKTKRKIMAFFNKFWKSICCLIPLRNTVLFYTIRADGKLLGNSETLYNALDTKKVIFAHMLPHSKKILPRLYFHLLTCKVIVTDDYLKYMRTTKLRKGQKLIQIWHACGSFKKFGLDVPSRLTRAEEIGTHSQYNAVCVTADGCKKHYAAAFGIDEDVCVALGSPRTDEIINNPEKLSENIYSKYPKLKGKKIYLYCPTFREEKGKQTKYDPKIDWDRLSESLDDDEVFIIRRHPIMKYQFTQKEYPNILDLSNDSTLELTAISKVIITDYSSVIYDACLLGVSCVFYCPDYKNYERGFYLNFPDDLPGEMITDAADLLTASRNAAASPDTEKVEKFKKEQLSACDGHSTERIANQIKEWLK